MGIKDFLRWMVCNFKSSVHTVKHEQLVCNTQIGNTAYKVNTLLLDMNGIIHRCAQRIFKYGDYTPRQAIMKLKVHTPEEIQNNKRVLLRQTYHEVCKSIHHMIVSVRPKKNVIICIDGTAPVSKQNQQRQRRYRASQRRSKRDQKKVPFDSCSISPGTEFLTGLATYIKLFIKHMMKTNTIWKSLQIVFSSDKTPGEGEHKLLQYIRLHGCVGDSYCIFGMDADLFMLALGTNIANFWVLRPNQYDRGIDYYLVNIDGMRSRLCDMMHFTPTRPNIKYDKAHIIYDFIMLFFMCGNDFLPHIPSIEIIMDGIETMITTYRQITPKYGHLTKFVNNRIYIAKKAFYHFIHALSEHDTTLLKKMVRVKQNYIERDLMLEKHYSKDDDTFHTTNYKTEYYMTKFSQHVPKQYTSDMKSMCTHICHEYITGIQWVLTYYIQGVRDWEWRYPYHYAPFASEIAGAMVTFVQQESKLTNPTVPYNQLLSILPITSSTLLPNKLAQLMHDKTLDISEYYPTSFKIDLAGKKREWEGVALVPVVDINVIRNHSGDIIKTLTGMDKLRNTLTPSTCYTSVNGVVIQKKIELYI